MENRNLAELATDAVALTKALIRIPSVNPPGDEEDCARFVARLLEAIGFGVTLQQFGERRFNLVADLAGSGDGDPIGFTGHFDTVPLGNAAWSCDPFSAEESNGRVHGRGSSDMKAGIAAFIAACASVLDDLKKTAGVHLVLTGGEETGCDGAKALAAVTPPLIRKLSLLIVGEPTSNYPYIGHKGALWLRGTAHGKTAHGSMPEQGSNAIYKAVRAIDQLQQFEMNERHALMGRPTLNVGTIRGGLNINSVPDKTEFEIDIRTVPGMEHQCLCDRISHFLTSEIDMSVLVDVPPLSTDPGHAAIRRVFELCAPFHPEPLVERAVPYFTDGSVLVPVTGHPPTIILGPGEPQVAHKTDEYCVIERINQSVQVYRNALLDPALRQLAANGQPADT